MPVKANIATIYTDGSCHTQKRVGAWVTIVLVNEGKVILLGTDADTTHQRMELIAVIKGIEFINTNHPTVTLIRIITDSQYVSGLPARKEKLAEKDFSNKKGTAIQNTDLVKKLFHLLSGILVTFVKIKAHQDKSEVTAYNIEADTLSRKMVRELVKKTNDTLK